jgi:AcrR family transcriptional regulator
METRTRALRPPKQDRSQQTLNRILGAASQVLEEKSFDDATLSEIVRRAGVTTGAFYARFAGKESLLWALEEQLYADARKALEELLAPERPVGLGVSELIHEILRVFARLYREHRGAARALTLRARSDAEVQARRLAFNREVASRVFDSLASLEVDHGHPDPGLAMRVGALFGTAALREAVLFRDYWPENVSVSEDVLVGELARAWAAYLTVKGE